VDVGGRVRFGYLSGFLGGYRFMSAHLHTFCALMGLEQGSTTASRRHGCMQRPSFEHPH
jgi:hypothetical protein